MYVGVSHWRIYKRKIEIITSNGLVKKFYSVGN